MHLKRKYVVKNREHKIKKKNVNSTNKKFKICEQKYKKNTKSNKVCIQN